MTTVSDPANCTINSSMRAVERGVFGAPTFFVEEQMFWGQDRMEQVKAALKA